MNKADFSYNDGSIRYENAGNSAWGQFTDGYFTIGLAYTFNVGKASYSNVSNRGNSSSRGTKSSTFARSTKVNKKANAYKKKVSKNRNKAFQKKNKKGGRVAW